MVDLTRALGALTVVLLVGVVVVRTIRLRKRGIEAMRFAERDKSDFLIPPFALFYFYLIFAGAFHWPLSGYAPIVRSSWLPWLGVACCAAGLTLMIASLVSFGESFRVGIDADKPGDLVTSGVFRFTRNPIYVAFALVLLGELLIQPRWVFVAYVVGGVALFHRQVLREEAYLREHYGEAYAAYCRRVRRYV